MAKRKPGIDQLPSGKWRARIDTGIDHESGKRGRHSKTFDRYADAAAWLAEREAHKAKGAGPAASGRQTAGEWFDEWLAAKRADVGRNTWDSYRSKLDHLRPLVGRQPLKDVKLEHLEKALARMAERGKTEATIRNAIKTARRAFAEAVRRGRLVANPAEHLKLPRLRTADIKPWTAEEARRFLKSVAGHRQAVLFRLALGSGARFGELAALDVPDYDAASGVLSVTKSATEAPGGAVTIKDTKTGAAGRRVHLAPGTRAALAAHTATLPGPVLLPDSKGGRLRRTNLGTTWKRLQAAAGVPVIRFHDLRHTCASLLIQANVNIKTVSERLGHDSIKTTLKHYAHLMPGMQERAAEAMSAILDGAE